LSILFAVHTEMLSSTSMDDEVMLITFAPYLN
jgi:hypothetical protein